MVSTNLWAVAELEAALRAYLAVLASPRGQATFSPTSLHRALVKGPLAGRTEASVGRRMSNISTVLKDADEPWISRYPASLPHVGAGVSATLIQLLEQIRGEANKSTIYPKKAAERANVLRARGRMAKPAGNPTPAQKRGSRTVYVRDPHVVAWVAQEANGICEACGLPAPFETYWGAPYLEVHHIKRLADAGPDTVDNAAALCPNCHRRLHHSSDAEAFRKTVLGKVDRLVPYD